MEEGKRFSLVYLDKGAPIQDSERFRRRLASFFDQNFIAFREEISNKIELETGSKVPFIVNFGKIIE